MVKNILALLDFSPISADVVSQAGELAKFYGARCWLMHVADPEPDFVGYEIGPQYVRDHKAAKLFDEHEKLQEFKRDLIDSGIDCEALLIQGQIHPTIIAEIKKLQADLVVLGSHGHTRLYDLLVGSVSEHLLRHQSVPILILPSKSAD